MSSEQDLNRARFVWPYLAAVVRAVLVLVLGVAAASSAVFAYAGSIGDGWGLTAIFTLIALLCAGGACLVGFRHR